MKTKIQSKQIIIGAIIALAGLAGIAFYFNRTQVFDWFSGLSYTPTQEVIALEDSIGLTDAGKLILRATHPALDSREDFNYNCDSHDSDISILGCYSDNRIYIYNVTEEQLNGIRESTLAHELLHAVWERLSDSEKNRLSAIITELFNSEEYNSLLSENLENYNESDRIDELHSRIATEIAEIPDELQSHYAKYFTDRQALIKFYNSYIDPFRKLSDKLEEIADKLKTLDSTVNEKTQAYYANTEKLSTEIDEFNKCAETAGCFATDYAFRVRRNELVTSKNALENEYNAINDIINQYNALVKEYNENVVRSKTLESIINSNSKVEDIK